MDFFDLFFVGLKFSSFVVIYYIFLQEKKFKNLHFFFNHEITKHGIITYPHENIMNENSRFKIELTSMTSIN